MLLLKTNERKAFPMFCIRPDLRIMKPFFRWIPSTPKMIINHLRSLPAVIARISGVSINCFWTISFILLSGTSVLAQLIQLDPPQHYNRVFVDSDNFGASYLDQLEKALPEIEGDSLKLLVLNDLAYYWHTRNLEQALGFAESGLILAERFSSDQWVGRFLITKAAVLLRLERLDEAEELLNKARFMVDDEERAFAYTQLGYVFERRGKLDEAADFAMESLKIGEQLSNRSIMALAYSDLSNLFWKHSKYDEGLEYGLRAIDLFEQVGLNSLDYDFTLYVVGNNLLELRRFKEALNYYNHSIAIGERYGFYNNLSDVYISLTDLHAYLQEYDKAHEAGQSAVKYAALLENNFLLMRSWLSIGKLQLLEGKYQSAIESLLTCIEVATPAFGDMYYLSQAYNSLGKAFAGNHNYKDAYEAFGQYDRLKDQIFTEEAEQRISLLRTEFEVAEKESTIIDQENRLKRQRTNQTMITVIASLLFTLLLLLFVTFRNNRKKNLLLEKKNEEKEFLLKEIHHRVKNNLGIVSSLLELQAAKMKDRKTIAAIHESRNRVYSMSMIHQRLYQGKNLSSIEMKDYLINLSRHILDSFGMKDRIRFKYVLESLELDVDTAIPIGLIVNELITNALKHAYPDGKEGVVSVKLIKELSGGLLLEVGDDGVGMLETVVEDEEGAGFGTQLIHLLLQQLDAKMTEEVHEGTRVSIHFAPPESKRL